jgi:CBS domain-containing protein
MSRSSAFVRCSDQSVLEDADGSSRSVRQARDVMISTSKTLPARASLDTARAVMADDHVHMVLLTDGDKLCGTLVRADLPPAGFGDDPALRWAVLRGRTVPPDTPVALVQARLIRTKMRRLAVVDADRTLLGLVCLKRSRSGFCSDADVAARASAVTTNSTEDPR